MPTRKQKALLTVMGGGAPKSAPTAAMGWRAYWNAMDAATLFTDDGTTPVANTGDLVYRMNEKLTVVANSQFTQGIETNRPAYTTGGANGRSYLAFDGSDNKMVTSVAGGQYLAAAEKTIIIAADIGSFANSDTILTDVNTLFLVNLTTTGGNKLQWANYDGSYDVIQNAFSINTPIVYAMWHSGGNLYTQLNGGTISSATASGNTVGVLSTLELFFHGTTYTPGKFYALAMANVKISDANIALVVNYFKSELAIA